jgi:hypothetical protein
VRLGAGQCLLASRSFPSDATEGGFTRSVVGFLFGFSLASSYAAYRLVDEYKQASTILQASVEELRATATKASGFRLPITPNLQSEQVSTHLERIEIVEKDLKALSETTVAKDDFVKLRAEVKKVYDGLHIGLSPQSLCTASDPLTSCAEFLDLRSHVWGIRRCIQSPAVNQQLTAVTCGLNQNKIFKLFRKKSEVLFDSSSRSCLGYSFSQMYQLCRRLNAPQIPLGRACTVVTAVTQVPTHIKP